MQQLCTIENINEADKRARKSKSRSILYIQKHDKNKEIENEVLLKQFSTNTFRTSTYNSFKIYEPKERIIYKLPYYPDRIAQHAIMRVVKQYWTNRFISQTFSCIEGRGIHSCLNAVKKALKDKNNTKYCLKLDIRKFYPSIDHQLLKNILSNKIKDKRFLNILFEIIDSVDSTEELKSKGIPIGNYLSQYFSNIFLTPFDYWCKQKLHCKYYFRYADDIIILSNNKKWLHQILICIKLYLTCVLKLKVKDNYQIFPVDARGIDFVGYVIRHDYIKIRKSIKKRLFHTIYKYLNNGSLKRRLTSYAGWLKYCNSKHLLQKIYNITGFKFSNFIGKQDSITKYLGKPIYIINIDIKPKYYNIQFIYNKKNIQVTSNNNVLLNALRNIKLPTIKILNK